jgi:hypothetical protein
MNECSGVSMDEARGFRLKVVCVYIATMRSSASVFRARGSARGVERLQIDQLLLVERREVFA